MFVRVAAYGLYLPLIQRPFMPYGCPGPVAKPGPDDYASSVHVVGQVITHRSGIRNGKLLYGTTIWYCL